MNWVLSERSDYGDAVVTRQSDGTLTVDRADDRICVSIKVLEWAGFERFGSDGTFVLDSAGEYRYLPVRFELGGTALVCQRVNATPTTDAEAAA